MTTTLDNPPATDIVIQPTQNRVAAKRPARFRAAWRSEWIKLATVRAPKAITGLTVVVGGLAAFMMARFVTDEEITVANVFGFSAVFTAVFAAVSGILIYTVEAEHHTAHQTFGSEPRRNIVIAAKTAVTSCYTAALGLAGLAAGALGAALGGVEAGDTSTIPTTIGWAIGFAVLAGVLGLGIGLIARQSAAAISGVLVWWLVIENLVIVFAPERVVRLLPFFAGNGMLQIIDEGEQIAFDRPITALIFASYAVVALLLGTVAVHRTDP